MDEGGCLGLVTCMAYRAGLAESYPFFFVFFNLVDLFKFWVISGFGSKFLLCSSKDLEIAKHSF